MKPGRPQRSMASIWQTVGVRFLPFADAASADLPLARLLRLALFQISVGMALVLLTGTLNRVMIIELGVPASLVALMIAIPVLAAPFRVLMGHRSDTYRSVLGWRRVPFIWMGTMLQFGGLAIMPFALLLFHSQSVGPDWMGPAGAALAFLLTGTGMHMVQTTGLALATDLAAEESRPRVVALVYVMLLVGMVLASAAFSVLLDDFSPKRLVEVIQGAAVFTLIINVIALWKQEPRNPEQTRADRVRPKFRAVLTRYRQDPRSVRLLLAVALGSAGFSMQDVLLEPYGAEILGLGVAQTTALTGLWAFGTLAGFALAAYLLKRDWDMHRVAGVGALIGIFALSAVVVAAPVNSSGLFRIGTIMIGFGGGLFAVGTMLAAMDLAEASNNGFAIGAWSAVQATAIGLALALGGILRDLVNAVALRGGFGEALALPSTGYNAVYHLEIGLLFITLIVLGPLTERQRVLGKSPTRRFGLADLPG